MKPPDIELIPADTGGRYDEAHRYSNYLEKDMNVLSVDSRAHAAQRPANA